MKLRRVEYSIGMSINHVDPHQIKTGWFHGWFQYQDGDEADGLAIIEREDGTVGTYATEWIRFMDKPPEEVNEFETQINCEHSTCIYAIESRPGRGLAKPDLAICSCSAIEIDQDGQCVSSESR